MGYSDLFKKRISVNGSNLIERRFNRAVNTFNRYFENTMNRYLVTVDGIEEYVAFQDQNQNNNKDLSDDKYVVAPLSSNMKVGSYVVWDRHAFIVFSDEDKTIKTHKQVKVKPSNHVMKWLIGEDDVCNNGNGYPAYVQNQTLYTLGVSTSGNHSWIINAKMTLYLPNNQETASLRLGQRIFVGNNVYQIMFMDTVSRKGMINYLLEEDFINPKIDNVELGIANYYPYLSDDVVEEGTTPEVDQPNSTEVVIDGPAYIKINSQGQYNAKVYVDGTETDDEIVEWTVSDVDGVVSIVEQSPTYIRLKATSNFQYVGSVATVIGKTASGEIGSKTIYITSPY